MYAAAVNAAKATMSPQVEAETRIVNEIVATWNI